MDNRRRRHFQIWTVLVALLALVWLWWFLGVRSLRVEAGRRPAARVLTAAAEKELEQFRGSWECVALEVEGQTQTDAKFERWVVRFEGDQWIVSEGTNLLAQCTIVLDPTARPRTIDAYPPPGKGLPIHGIYLLDRDQLTICDRGEDNGDRPVDFDEEPTAGLVRIVIRRPRP